MDGLLVDSEPVWTVAEVELARSLGGEFSPELKAAIVGTRLEVAVPRILRWYDAPAAPADVDRACAWLLARMVELFAGDLPVMPGAASLVAACRAAAVPVALVSSSYRVLVDAVLAGGGLPAGGGPAGRLGPFDLTVAGDEVTHAKPHPEPWLTACSRLGVDPSRCVVLEDSPSGVASGLAAGCAVVGVPSVAGVSFESAPRLTVRTSLVGLGLADLQALVA
ncbi:MAG: HAD family phosphatase [Pseudorhodobacter sp.]|nr:HAD family phosphatase [Frankiaceae bacterium]